MATDDPQPGRASGYSVEDDPDGGFNWSAFGPAGVRQGYADLRADAEAAARMAEKELSRPAARGS